MSEFVIVADVSGDLSPEMAGELGVVQQSMVVVLDGREYRHYPDYRELGVKAFYDALRGGATVSTAAANAAEFAATAEPYLTEGKDILFLPFSSGLSATYQAAAIATEELSERHPARKIYAVDTLSAALGHGLLLWHAATLQKQGADIDAVRAWVEENRLKIHHNFTVEDLHHLHRGGRVSAATAVVGSMLSIKPILHVNTEGKLESIDKVRGRAASIRTLVDRMERDAVAPEGQTVFISHGDCEDEANALADMIRQRLGTQQFVIRPLGPVIGAHTGPGVLALFYVGTGRQ